MEEAATIFYTLEEILKHDGKQDPRTWIIIRDVVYDVTDYLNDHPGGPELIQEWAGKDGTREFDNFGHSGDAKRELKKYKIGEVVEFLNLFAREPGGNQMKLNSLWHKIYMCQFKKWKTPTTPKQHHFYSTCISLKEVAKEERKKKKKKSDKEKEATQNADSKKSKINRSCISIVTCGLCG